MGLRTHARNGAGLVAIIVLAVLAGLSIWVVMPPAPKGASTPPGQFSASRAFQHVSTIGRQVHVAGSPAATSVRDYIVSTLRSYGLSPKIQDAVGASDALGHGYAMARVRNVVAVLPGTNSTGRVIDTAHYDSVQVSYGANDDGAGVASLLETARALASGPRLRNDVVFLFTDAEEACLCGAEAFVSQDPVASSGGVMLNFESRGSSGPAIMFETSRDNAGVVDVYGDSVPHPVATSFAVEVYRILPNDTDFTPFRESHRFTGLNTAYIDGSAVYHSPEDKPSYMDKGSLQQQGANALALTRAFGAADIATLRWPSSHDSTYFPVLGHLVRYPGWLVWPFAVTAALAVAGLALLASRRRVASLGRSAAGFGLALIPLLLSAVLAQVLWLVLMAIRPGYQNMIDPWRPGWYRASVIALVAAVILGWYGLFRRRFGMWALTIGGLGWLVLLGLVLAFATPGGSYLAALPALAGALASIAVMRRHSATPAGPRPPGGWLNALVLSAGGALAVLILAPTVALFFPALGLATGGAAAFFAAMLGLAVLPLLASLFPARPESGEMPPRHAAYVPVKRSRTAGALPGLVAFVLAVAFTATGLSVDRFDARHPAPEQLMYALDADTGTAQWISTDSSPGAWNKRYVKTKRNLHEMYPVFGDAQVLTGPAATAVLPAPALSVDSDTSTSDGRRTVILTIKPQRDVRLVYFEADEASVASAVVDGRAVGSKGLRDLGVTFHAPPPAGLRVVLALNGTGQIKFRVMDGSDGLDGLPGYTPRPAGIGIEGSHDTELVLVAKTYTV